ncbi:hypothetical protein OY671_006273 [Metschnikowia pulcherrima]|nr:hypothetical protein OY671_006273 [Metschnikowia pulcherrima]
MAAERSGVDLSNKDHSSVYEELLSAHVSKNSDSVDDELLKYMDGYLKKQVKIGIEQYLTQHKKSISN